MSTPHPHHSHEHRPSDDLAEIAAEEASRRAQAREPLRLLPDAELDEALERAWRARRDATDAIARATEEKIVRLLRQRYPHLTRVVLVEDASHDQPHGHVGPVYGPGDALIIDGRSEAWHDLEWAHELDELAWDLHHLDREGFLRVGGTRERSIGA